MFSANVIPSAPPGDSVIEDVENFYTTPAQLYPNIPATTNAENFRLTEISKIEKEIACEVEYYRLVLKKYKKVRKVNHYSVVCLGAATAALSSGAVVVVGFFLSSKLTKFYYIQKTNNDTNNTYNTNYIS